jgi:hypothetical protein
LDEGGTERGVCLVKVNQSESNRFSEFGDGLSLRWIEWQWKLGRAKIEVGLIAVNQSESYQILEARERDRERRTGWGLQAADQTQSNRSGPDLEMGLEVAGVPSGESR